LPSAGDGLPGLGYEIAHPGDGGPPNGTALDDLDAISVAFPLEVVRVDLGGELLFGDRGVYAGGIRNPAREVATSLLVARVDLIPVGLVDLFRVGLVVF